LERKIAFLEIGQLNEQTMRNISNVLNPRYEDFVAADAQARAYVKAQIAQ
jgi:1-deoxy-D-xylulose 5-phosphate reductoisomerase